MAPIIVYLTTWSLLLAIPSLCFPVTTHITPYNSPEPHSGPIHARTIASGECEDLPYIFIHPLHSVPIIKRPKKVPDRVAVGVWFRKDKVDDVMLYNWYLEQDPDVARIPALVERPDMADKLNPAHPNNPDGYNKLWFDEDVELLDRPSPYEPGTPQEKEKLKADYEKKLEEIYQSTLASLKQKQIQALDTKTVDANGNTITVQGLCRSTIRDSQVEQQPWTPGIRPRPPLGPGRLDSAAWKSASPSGKNLKSLKNSVQADSPANGSAGR
ncbi:hypothetical protein FRB99_005339 [Tulasnella sp. 403]|nr:hypothetical protein FRB99_005339 [Tulasnella sp. 403]